MKMCRLIFVFTLWLACISIGAQRNARHIFGHNSFTHRSTFFSPNNIGGPSININLMGEVAAPGVYTLPAGATLFDALSAASGLTPIGSLREVELWRSNKLLTKADLYPYLLHGDTTAIPRLKDGDLLIVPTACCLVQVQGAVKRAMSYEALPSENINDLLAYAGGLRQAGCERWIQVVRAEENGRKVFSLDSLERQRFLLCHGDIVLAENPPKEFFNRVDISGAVMRPGMYRQGAEGDSTVLQLLQSACGLDEGAFTERVLLYRERRGMLEILPLNLQAILEGRQPDMALCNKDLLHIPYREEVRAGYQISVFGAVQRPGSFRYAEQMTVADAVLLAGGLKDAAMGSSVEIVRRWRDRKALSKPTGKILFSSYSVALNADLQEMGDTAFRLQPYDEIYVRTAPRNMAQRHVSIEGEVQFPGIYVLSEKDWRLTDLLTAAGGPTNAAHLPDAVLERKLKPWERKVLEEFNKDLGSDYTEHRFYPLGLPRKKVETHLDAAVASPENSVHNFLLEEGDRLYIPRHSPTVSIYGEVVSPSVALWMKGKGLGYYADHSGGYTSEASSKHAFILYPNGKAARLKRTSDIRPGCTIFVPSRRLQRRWASADIDPHFLLTISQSLMLQISQME